MGGPRGLVHELHRRSIWQVVGIFLAASWGVVEVVDFLTEKVGLPDWTPTMALVLLLIGLPIVVATAFVQEGMPGSDDGAGAKSAGTTAPSEGAAPSLPGAVAAAAPANMAAGTGSLDRPTTRPSQTRRLLTWRNAILGGLGAFTLLGISIFTYFVMWTSGIGPVGNLVAQGVFEEGEAVVLSDFADATGANLGDVVTEAIRVDLQESSVISLVPPAYVSGGLARMGLPADAKFTADVARELALRDGLKAVIQGEVASVGSGYLLTASLLATESGDILKAFRVPVASQDDILAGIDKLSQDIREQSGESLRSIRQGAGLEEATTSSLDALRLYTEAVRSFDEGRQMEAIPLLEESLELDPEFAMAWRKLSVILNNQGLDASRVRDASRRAFELRRRLTDREAGLAEAWFLSIVQDNPEAAIDAYRRVLDRYPDESTALNNVAVRLLQMGRWEEAETPLRRMMTGPSPSASGYANLIQILWNVGKHDEAWAWHDSLTHRYPEALDGRQSQSWLLAAEGRWSEAHDVSEDVWRDAPSGGLDHIFALTEMAGSDVAQGKYEEAMRHLAGARRNTVEARAWEIYYRGPAFMTLDVALAMEGQAAARRTLAALEGEVPLDSIGARSAVRPIIARFHGLSGDQAGSERIFSAYEAAFAPEERGRAFRVTGEQQRAIVAWGQGDWASSASSFGRLYEELQPCSALCISMAEWGIALEEAGRPDEALEKYRWHVADTQLAWHVYRAMWTPTVLERMGGLYEAQGNTAEARAAYQQLVDRFSQGDGPFVPLVARARARLAALGN
ncbi:MAG TPA: tetratricopeptide repeat protein [Longimicrobiales bacterium]|nr:tetratricopeptide repeat protein [Longimicrobiales bacterium]